MLDHIFGGKRGRFGTNVDRAHSGMDDTASGPFRTLQEQPIQHGARIDDDRMVQAQVCAMAIGGDEFDLLNQLLGLRTIKQKRIIDEGFVCEASAAGFLPSEVLIENCDFETGGRKLLTAQSAGWPATHNGNSPNRHVPTLFHRGWGQDGGGLG